MSETASASKTERRKSETRPKNLSNPEEKEGKRRKKRKKKMGNEGRKEEGEGERWKARSLSIRATFSLKGHPREWHGTDMVKSYSAKEVTWKRHGNRGSFINKEGERPAEEGKETQSIFFLIFPLSAFKCFIFYISNIQQYSAIFSNIQQYDIACNYRNVQKRKMQLSLKSSSKGLDHNCMQFEVLQQCFYMTCKESAISEKAWRVKERRHDYKISMCQPQQKHFLWQD